MRQAEKVEKSSNYSSKYGSIIGSKRTEVKQERRPVGIPAVEAKN